MNYNYLVKVVSSLKTQIKELKEQNLQFKKENSILRERLNKYEHPKNSRNNSMPPSQDQNRPKPNQSLRKPSDKKPRGQKGREGKTLEVTAIPDEIIELHPYYCKN